MDAPLNIDNPIDSPIDTTVDNAQKNHCPSECLSQCLSPIRQVDVSSSFLKNRIMSLLPHVCHFRARDHPHTPT